MDNGQCIQPENIHFSIHLNLLTHYTTANLKDF